MTEILGGVLRKRRTRKSPVTRSSRRFEMCNRYIAIMSVLALTAGSAMAQAPAKVWTPSRTADGQPDLQGTWTNATLTPFQRPPELAGKATITEQEAAALEKKASENRVDRPPKPGDPGSYNQAWSDGGTTWLST